MVFESMPDRSISTKATIPIDSIAGIFFHTSMKIPVLFIVTSLILTFSLQGETVKDREGAVRADAKKMEGTDRWLYNDLETAFAEAENLASPSWWSCAAFPVSPAWASTRSFSWRAGPCLR